MADEVFTFQINTDGMTRVIQATKTELDKLGRATSEGIINDIKLSFNTSPAGRTYTRGSITHVASVAGYPPNVDTGALRASMHWKDVGDFEWHVMDGVEYGYWLEEGTSKMQPRPFVRPVFADWRKRKFLRLVRAMKIGDK